MKDIVSRGFSIGAKVALYPVVLLIITIFIWSRIEIVPTHFTHYDDLYAPYLFTVIGQYDPAFFSSQLEKYGGVIGSILAPVIFDFFSNYPSIFAFIKSLLTPIAIAKTSTFAPLQFYLTALTIDFDTSYTVSKTTFRLPSAIFSLMALFMLYQFSKKMEQDEGWYIFIIGSTVLSVSWMFLIYSSQGENFAAGIFSLLTMLYMYMHYKNSEASIKSSLKFGFFLSLLCLLHYQTIFFLPGLFLALFYDTNFSIKDFLKRCLGVLLLVSTTLLGIYYVFLRDRLKDNPGVHWNAGSNGQYVFNADCSDGFFGCVAQVFVDNFFEVFQSIVSFSNLSESSSIIYTLVLLLLSLLGLVHLYKNKQHRGLLVFIVTAAVVWVFLVLMGKLAFSPTRHSLILLALVAILSSLGLHFVVNLFGRASKFVYVAPIFSIMVLTAYVLEFDDQKHKRIDPLEKTNIQNIVNQYSPDSIIAYSREMHLEFFPGIKLKYNANYINEYPYYTLYSKKVSNDKERLLILCVSGELCGPSSSKPVEGLLKEYYSKNVKYTRIFTHEENSTVLNGFGSRAGSGTNGLYINIWDINEKKQ